MTAMTTGKIAVAATMLIAIAVIAYNVGRLTGLGDGFASGHVAGASSNAPILLAMQSRINDPRAPRLSGTPEYWEDAERNAMELQSMRKHSASMFGYGASVAAVLCGAFLAGLYLIPLLSSKGESQETKNNPHPAGQT